MDKRTKILAIISLLVVISGVFLLSLGLKSVSTNNINLKKVSPSASSVSEAMLPSSSSSSSEVSGLEGERTLVTKVVDGDTIEVLGGRKVRLLGVDTPETVDPRKSVQCFGKEASNKTKELLNGKEVILQKDVSETDKYKRLLRFVFLPLKDGNYLFIDDYLIREGYGKVLTIPPDVKYADQFLEAQIQARESKKGLWGSC